MLIMLVESDFNKAKNKLGLILAAVFLFAALIGIALVIGKNRKRKSRQRPKQKLFLPRTGLRRQNKEGSFKLLKKGFIKKRA